MELLVQGGGTGLGTHHAKLQRCKVAGFDTTHPTANKSRRAHKEIRQLLFGQFGDTAGVGGVWVADHFEALAEGQPGADIQAKGMEQRQGGQETRALTRQAEVLHHGLAVGNQRA